MLEEGTEVRVEGWINAAGNNILMTASKDGKYKFTDKLLKRLLH